MITEPIKVEGLALLAKQLRKLNKDAPKALRLVHNEAAQLVVDTAVPNVPRKTGKAQAALKARSTRTESRAQGGSTKAPYYPWLDFGGRVGIKNSVRRPVVKSGRYIYPAYVKRRADVLELLETALVELCRDNGLDVSG